MIERENHKNLGHGGETAEALGGERSSAISWSLTLAVAESRAYYPPSITINCAINLAPNRFSAPVTQFVTSPPKGAEFLSQTSALAAGANHNSRTKTAQKRSKALTIIIISHRERFFFRSERARANGIAKPESEREALATAERSPGQGGFLMR